MTSFFLLSCFYLLAFFAVTVKLVATLTLFFVIVDAETLIAEKEESEEE